MSDLVTGEAVVLGLRPAKLPSRALAVVVDLVLYWGVYIAVSVGLTGATATLDGAAVAAVAVATFVLVQIGIPIVVETLSHGRSLGKLMCGLRVLREDGGPIRFRHALVRGAVGAIEIVLTMGVVACIASLVSARGRRLGDVFAGTLVVRERVPEGHPGMGRLPEPPPWLAAELGALDLSRVPDGWWLAVRQCLGRIRQLDPQIGGAMAVRLAEDLRGFTGVPMPQGMHPAVYLAAVVGERQMREARRAFGGSAAAHAGAHAGAHAEGQPAPYAVRAPGGPVLVRGAEDAVAGGRGPVPPSSGVVGSGAVAADAVGAVPVGGVASGPGHGADGGGVVGGGAVAGDLGAEGRGSGSGTEAPRTGFAPPG